MPLDEGTKKLLAASGFSQDSSGKYNYTGNSSATKTANSSSSGNSNSSKGSTKKYSDMSNADMAQALTDYQKEISGPSASSEDNQYKYLTNLANMGDAGQKIWANSQLSLLTPAMPTASNSSNKSPASTNYLDRLSLYATDPTAANTEIERAKSVYNQKMAAGDITGANAAHTWANQIRDKLGQVAGTDYDPVTGASVTPKQTNLELIQSLIPKLPELTTTLPEYEPYSYQKFKFTPPDYSITSDPDNTSFLPTASAKDRWLQEQQAKADQSYKSYTADADNWAKNYQVNADQIANLASLLPYDTLTAAQQATIDQAKAEAEAAAAQAQVEAERWAAEFGLKQRETDYATGKPYYNPDSGSSSAKPTTADYVSVIVSAQDQYKTPADYKADLIRNKATIISLVGGLSNYNALLNDAQAQIEAGNKINPNFETGKVYGSNKETSPLTYALSSFSSPTSGSSGSVDSWVSTAMKSAGVGSDWTEPVKWIISKESSGNPQATNPSSGAYGLMQFLPQTWGNYGFKKTSDPTQQVIAGIAYIKARYGTAANAKAFWQKNGWY